MHTRDYNFYYFKSYDDYIANISSKINELDEEFDRDSDIDYADIQSIKELSLVCGSKKEASEFLRSKFNENEYNSYMVKYIDKVSSKQVTLEDRIIKEKQKLKDYMEKNDISHHKSATVGCEKCGSKLATKYMKGQRYCPLCRNDLWSKTIKDTISRYNDNINKMTREYNTMLREGIKGNVKQTRVAVLLAYDYHS